MRFYQMMLHGVLDGNRLLKKKVSEGTDAYTDR